MTLGSFFLAMRCRSSILTASSILIGLVLAESTGLKYQNAGSKRRRQPLGRRNRHAQRAGTVGHAPIEGDQCRVDPLRHRDMERIEGAQAAVRAAEEMNSQWRNLR